MTLVLDAGALIALERGDRAMWTRMEGAHRAGRPPITHGGVIGQVWRGRGSRQALLSRAISGIEVRPLDADLGRAAGKLLARAKTNDVIDAALVLVASENDVIVTSDPADIDRLVTLLDVDVDVLVV